MRRKDIVVKTSKIHKKGVFANRDFKRGEVVLRWEPKALKRAKIKELSDKEKHYLYQDKDGDYFLMQAPEKYVNHSCEANTRVRNKCDIATREIKKGQEITSDYNKEGSFAIFKCKCGSKKCKGAVGRK